MTHENVEQLLGDFRQLISNMILGHIKSLPVLDDFYDGVTITDSTGKICYINKVQLRIDDLEPQLVIGRPVTEVYRVDDGVSPTMQCLKNGEPILNLACFYRTHRGKMVNSIHNVFPLFWKGKIFGSICFIRDFQLTKSTLEQLSDAANSILPQMNVTPFRGTRTANKGNGTSFSFKDIIGKNLDFLRSINVARLVSSSPSPVFLYGETGTGKEVFAQSIHNESKRNKMNFIAIN
jgi:arginine utilization regulatory protein